ncbi:extracellular solute-binding protein [Microbacterium suaedae]|uniref:extracellular solute-binding protein n=1 Tax=Microbacterium suaedae TaxID=2067813 RepID=UPI001E3A1F07|nr:extracellular solute-binding protein [Microbacterium suaedae]
MNTKRALSTAAIGLCAVGALAACGPVSATGTSGDSSTEDGTNLTVFISGDTNIETLWEKGIIPAYEEENPGTSVSTTIDLHGEHDQQTVAKLTTATEAGESPGYDLVDAGFVVSSAAEAGTLLDVDAASVSGLETVPQGTIEAGKGVGIPYRASSVLLAYDTAKIADPPKTLDDLLAWIEENPGEFAYNSPSTGGSGGAFVTTVLDSYLSTEDQQAMRSGYAKELEAGWEPGFEKLVELGEFVYQGGVYPNGNNQVLELLASGEISMAPVWSDQFITGQATGMIPDTVAYTQISDPSFNGSASYLGIPKTSANTEAAIDLANFVLSDEGQQIIAEQISGYPVVSLDTLPSEVADRFVDADPSALRPGYFSEISADMANEWDQRVP